MRKDMFFKLTSEDLKIWKSYVINYKSSNEALESLVPIIQNISTNKPKKHVIHITVTPELETILHSAAEKNKVSVRQCVIEAILSAMANPKINQQDPPDKNSSSVSTTIIQNI